MYLKKNIMGIGVCMGLVLFLSGCPRRHSVVVPAYPNVLSKSPYSASSFQADYAAYQKEQTGDNDPEKLRLLRDRMVYGLMSEIDDSYGQFERVLFAGKADAAVLGDVLTLGLTAGSTIATHTPTKTILSALGTAFTGVNLSIDKNFFAQQTFQTIALGMQTRRDKARTQIVQGLWDDAQDYSFENAKRDLVAYFYAGTLPGGLQEIQAQMGNAAKEQTDHPAPGIH